MLPARVRPKGTRSLTKAGLLKRVEFWPKHTAPVLINCITLPTDGVRALLPTVLIEMPPVEALAVGWAGATGLLWEGRLIVREKNSGVAGSGHA